MPPSLSPSPLLSLLFSSLSLPLSSLPRGKITAQSPQGHAACRPEHRSISFFTAAEAWSSITDIFFTKRFGSFLLGRNFVVQLTAIFDRCSVIILSGGSYGSIVRHQSFFTAAEAWSNFFQIFSLQRFCSIRFGWWQKKMPQAPVRCGSRMFRKKSVVTLRTWSADPLAS